MKKNILTIIILALGILNMLLTAIIVFAVVPTTMKTNNLISKVATSIDLELQLANGETKDTIAISDIEVYKIENDMTINLKRDASDSENHYALVSASLSLNKKSKDFEKLQPTVVTNESYITEIITDEFSKYTMQEVSVNKEKIKADILAKVQEHFKSDFIISVSIGKLVLD
jgi:hypothetical protein